MPVLKWSLGVPRTLIRANGVRTAGRLSGRTMHSWYSCQLHDSGSTCDLDRAYRCPAIAPNSIYKMPTAERAYFSDQPALAGKPDRESARLDYLRENQTSA